MFVHVRYEVAGVVVERKFLHLLGIDIVLGECSVGDVVDEQPFFPFGFELTRYVYTAVEQGKSDFDESEVFGVARKGLFVGDIVLAFDVAVGEKSAENTFLLSRVK